MMKHPLYNGYNGLSLREIEEAVKAAEVGSVKTGVKRRASQVLIK